MIVPSVAESLVVKLRAPRATASEKGRTPYSAADDATYVEAMSKGVEHLVPILSEEDGITCRDALLLLANYRRDVAREMNDPHADSFGRWRQPGSAQQRTLIGAQYSAYAPRARLLLRDTEEHERLRSGVRLTRTRNNGDTPSWEHTSADALPDGVERMQACWRRVQAAQSNGTIWGAIADLHWWGAQLMPFFRGSAGILDALTKAVAVHHGLRLRRWRDGKSPDCEALVTTARTFRRRYRSLFEPALR